MCGEIILLVGVRGSGKDFFAEEIFLRDTDKSEIIGFSDGVREYSWKALGWSPKDKLEYEDFKNFEIVIQDKGELRHVIKGRNFLTNIGDEVMKHYDPDVWAKVWYQKAVDAVNNKGKEVIIAHDLRHVNEYNTALKMAKLFKMHLHVYFCDYKSERYEVSEHPSEALAVEILKMDMFKHREEITGFMRVNYEY